MLCRDYIIHLLHRVGAQRCKNVSGCSSGCSSGGSFDGKPKTSPVTTPDDEQAKRNAVTVLLGYLTDLSCLLITR